MRFDDSLYIQKTADGGYDKDLNPLPSAEVWSKFGNCIIMPNSKAARVSLNDGSEYIYQYEVIAPLKPKHYEDEEIPMEGSQVRIVKADGTIDREMTVKGFVTFKKRYLKLWM